jgi:hypothetical protein
MSEWERCRHWLDLALDGTHSIEDVRAEIEAGRAQFWPMPESACVTVVQDYPKGRALRVWLAGGDLDDLVKHLPVLDNYGREQGCGAIELEGRRGWERVLPGYRATRVVLRKEIGHG